MIYMNETEYTTARNHRAETRVTMEALMQGGEGYRAAIAAGLAKELTRGTGFDVDPTDTAFLIDSPDATGVVLIQAKWVGTWTKALLVGGPGDGQRLTFQTLPQIIAIRVFDNSGPFFSETLDTVPETVPDCTEYAPNGYDLSAGCRVYTQDTATTGQARGTTK